MCIQYLPVSEVCGHTESRTERCTIYLGLKVSESGNLEEMCEFVQYTWMVPELCDYCLDKQKGNGKSE